MVDTANGLRLKALRIEVEICSLCLCDLDQSHFSNSAVYLEFARVSVQ